jgi:hypothetical protein
MSVLISHMENWLGRIQSGWTRDHAGREVPFQVVECTGGKLEGSTSYATLGLSGHRLSGKDKPISLELVMTTHSALAPARLPQVLQTVGIALHARHEAILRGETFALPGAVAEGSSLSSVYAAVPGYFDEEFETVTIEDGATVVMVWLVPVSESERGYIHDAGWDAFEDDLVAQDPDLCDLLRKPIR